MHIKLYNIVQLSRLKGLQEALELQLNNIYIHILNK